MNGLDENFMRMQIFENQEQCLKFWNQVNRLENYNEKIRNKDSQYYVWIEFNFLKCVPLNILIDAIANKYLEVQNSQIKNISIEILKHFKKLKTQSILHGNILTKNIIIELQKNQFFDQSKNEMQIKNIYFTNYNFQQQTNDEQDIKNIFLILWRLIDSADSDANFIKAETLEEMTIENILISIQNLCIQDGRTKSTIKKIGSFLKQLIVETDYIQILSIKLKNIQPILKQNIDSIIENFINQKKEDNRNYNQLQQNLDQEISQNENDLIRNRIKSELEQQDQIIKEQKIFLDKLKKISLQNFVESVIQNSFQIIKEDSQSSDLQYQSKIDQSVDINFIIDKCFIDIITAVEISLMNFDKIQNTLKQKQQEINQLHYQNFQFQIDLPIKQIAKLHFDVFLSITQHNIIQIKKNYDVKINNQHNLIKEQLDDAYDAWISMKILEIIPEKN